MTELTIFTHFCYNYTMSPLIKSSSKKAMAKNIKTEIAHGKKPKQAVAIAYGVAKKAKK